MGCSAQGVSMNASFTDHFSCKICLEILNEPIQCQRNEHYFCKSCIRQHLARSQTCPLCMEELTLETLRPAPRVVTEVLSQLRTPRCDFIHRGCKEKVSIEDLPYHHEVCGFAPVLCSNEGCGATINRQDVTNHESESCNFRKVKCVDCAEDIVFGVYGRHVCVLRREVDKMKSCFEELQALQNVVKANSDSIKVLQGPLKELQALKDVVKTHGNSIKVLQDPLRNVTSSSQIFVASDKSFEVLDWTTKQWTLYENILFYPHNFSFSFPYKNNIMVCGGTTSNRIEYVNIKEDPITSYSFPMSSPEQRQCPGGKGALCGNRIFIFENSKVHEIVLDSPPSSWNALSLSERKKFYGVECIHQNIYIFGGYSERWSGKEGRLINKASNTVLLYDTSKSEMRTLAPLPYGVSEMATVPYKESVIILGGNDSDGKPYNSVVMYNVNSQECKRLPSMLQKRSGCAAVIMEKVIIVMGGHSDSECLNTVEYFVLGQDSWHKLPSMHRARYGATACLQP